MEIVALVAKFRNGDLRPLPEMDETFPKNIVYILLAINVFNICLCGFIRLQRQEEQNVFLCHDGDGREADSDGENQYFFHNEDINST